MKIQPNKQKQHRDWQPEAPLPIYRDIPLVWQSGTEEELRWVTRTICLTEPDLFDSKETVTAVYRAATDTKRCGFLYVERRGTYLREHYVTPRLMMLCELAIRVNACRGLRWIDPFGNSAKLQKEAIRIRVTMAPPSAHEKAEATLTLVDWCDGKLFDPRKRERCGLPPATVPGVSGGDSRGGVI